MSKRWSESKKDLVINKEIDLFLKEIVTIFQKYNLSIGHEDRNGDFLIEKYSIENSLWLQDAHDNTDKQSRDET
jgi:hypothetical protein